MPLNDSATPRHENFTLNQFLAASLSTLTTLNLTFPSSWPSNPSHTGSCLVGAVAPQDPADLSIFQHFKAPSQPPEIPGWEKALKIVFYVLAFLLIATGNTMVILVICLNKRMRSTTNVLLLNQALSDLMVAAVCMWVHLGNSITPEWPFGPFVCKVNTFCQGNGQFRPCPSEARSGESWGETGGAPVGFPERVGFIFSVTELYVASAIFVLISKKELHCMHVVLYTEPSQEVRKSRRRLLGLGFLNLKSFSFIS